MRWQPPACVVMAILYLQFVGIDIVEAKLMLEIVAVRRGWWCDGRQAGRRVVRRLCVSAPSQ